MCILQEIGARSRTNNLLVRTKLLYPFKLSEQNASGDRVGNQTQTSSFITLLEFIDMTIVRIIHLKI